MIKWQQIMTIIKNNVLLILFFILIFFAGILKKQTTLGPVVISKQDSALNFNHKLIQIFSLGHTRLISDILWITTLLESDSTHYKNKDLNSWLFHRFNTISQIDPLFLKNYQFGGKYLNIIKDDSLGAEYIFKKGLENYPADYELNFNLGFLYAFDIENFSESYKYFNNIKDNKRAPRYIESLLNKLKYKSTNDLELAFDLTLLTYETTKDNHLKGKLEKDLYAIKAEIDLKCLNKTPTKNCSKVDYYGENYLFTNGKYKSKYSFKKFDLYRKK